MLTSGPDIDIPLNVNFEMTRREPIESQLTITPPSVSGSTYTTTAVINSFGREQSGEYACFAMVTSETTNTFLTDSNSTSNVLRVTTGKVLLHVYLYIVYHILSMQVFILH